MVIRWTVECLYYSPAAYLLALWHEDDIGRKTYVQYSINDATLQHTRLEVILGDLVERGVAELLRRIGLI